MNLIKVYVFDNLTYIFDIIMNPYESSSMLFTLMDIFIILTILI